MTRRNDHRKKLHSSIWYARAMLIFVSCSQTAQLGLAPSNELCVMKQDGVLRSVICSMMPADSTGEKRESSARRSRVCFTLLRWSVHHTLGDVVPPPLHTQGANATRQRRRGVEDTSDTIGVPPARWNETTASETPSNSKETSVPCSRATRLQSGTAPSRPEPDDIESCFRPSPGLLVPRSRKHEPDVSSAWIVELTSLSLEAAAALNRAYATGSPCVTTTRGSPFVRNEHLLATLEQHTHRQEATVFSSTIPAQSVLHNNSFMLYMPISHSAWEKWIKHKSPTKTKGQLGHSCKSDSHRSNAYRRFARDS